MKPTCVYKYQATLSHSLYRTPHIYMSVYACMCVCMHKIFLFWRFLRNRNVFTNTPRRVGFFKAAFNWFEFSVFLLVWLPRPTLPSYLTIARERIVWFMHLPRVLALWEMQILYSHIQLHIYIYIREHFQLIMTTSITNEYTSLLKYKSLTLYFRKGGCLLCVRNEWRQGQTAILTQVLPRT